MLGGLDSGWDQQRNHMRDRGKNSAVWVRASEFVLYRTVRREYEGMAKGRGLII